jgi:integrase
MPKLTDRFLSAFKPAAGQKDRLAFDTECRGLGVRATAAGTRTFLVQWADPATGRKRREPLGVWGGITVDQAREAARVRLGAVAKGLDPRAEREAKRAAEAREREASRLTLRVLLGEWSRLGLKGRREGYTAEAVRAVSHAFAGHLDRPAHHLTRDEAVRVLDGLAEAGRAAMAGRTMAYGRACYGWAQKRGKVPSNPFQGLPVPAAIVSRDRVLNDQEIGEVSRAAGTLGFPFGPLVRLLLLTAQRREEVAAMRWSEISADMAVWTIPAKRAKNGAAHVVQLAPEARAILAEMPRFAGSDFVFTTTGKAPVSGFSKAKERLDAAVAVARAEAVKKDGAEVEPMPPWRLHDFRRSAVTWMAGAGIAPHVADKVLNHLTGAIDGVAAVYQRNRFLPERKAALEAWARHVLACGEGAGESNVVAADFGGRRGEVA